MVHLRENGVTLVSDEVHGLIIYGDQPFLPVLAVNELARRISVQVMSLSEGYNIMSLPHAIATIANPEMQAAWMRQDPGLFLRLCPPTALPLLR